MLATITQDF